MIEIKVETEFGEYKVSYNHGYKVNSSHFCIDDYKDVAEGWNNCPCCGLQPRIWTFDNGRSTACGCWNSKYDIFSVRAESIMSVHKRTAGEAMNEYKKDSLRLNWNEYCLTFINPCNHFDLRQEGKW